MLRLPAGFAADVNMVRISVRTSAAVIAFAVSVGESLGASSVGVLPSAVGRVPKMFPSVLKMFVSS